MDASALRWTLAIIGIVLLVGIYLYGAYQNRLRKRVSMETFTDGEGDNTFTEDEQLRKELDNLNQIMAEPDKHDEITTNPTIEADLAPLTPPSEWFVADILSTLDPEQVINYWLYRADCQQIASEPVRQAMQLIGLTMNTEGYMVYHHEGELSFMMANLSPPGDFIDIEQDEFLTHGFNCFIDLKTIKNPLISYEIMLKKIDELVNLLNLKVCHPDHDLLTIDDVTDIRLKLND